jgi:hypothetical protein
MNIDSKRLRGRWMGDLGYRVNGGFDRSLAREFSTHKHARQMDHAPFRDRVRRSQGPQHKTLGSSNPGYTQHVEAVKHDVGEVQVSDTSPLDSKHHHDFSKADPAVLRAKPTE